MNDQPPESFLTRYVLENPWPVGIFLFLAGFALIILWLNRGENRLLIAAGACSVLMGLTFLLAWLVVTPGEQARDIVHQMVTNAERGDVDGILASISPEASIHLGSLKRPGQNFSQLEQSIRSLGGTNRITKNTITKLRAWTTGTDSAVVQLGCRTETGQSWTAVPTSWMFKLKRGEDDDWVVTRIAFRSLAGKEPTRLLR